MRKISDTIARLAALHAQHVPYSAVTGALDALQSLTVAGSNPGALKAWCHVPDDLRKGAPLVVVLHGCTQNAAGYDRHSGWSQLADEVGFTVLYPEQQHANNPSLCFNWFLPADVRRNAGEALSIRQMIEAMVVAYKLDRERIFITGLSAGGAMAAAMLATYPEVFAGGAIIAGLPYGSATTVPEAFDRMRGHGGPCERNLQRAIRSASDHHGPWPRISIWHGAADHTVSASNAEAIAAQWRGIHGLDKVPTHSEMAGRLARQVWLDTSGETTLEINMIGGMGHGTPIGNDGLGTPGPYMLNVGISSTREITRFWRIAGTQKSVFERSAPKSPAVQRQHSRGQTPTTETAKVKSQELTAIHEFSPPVASATTRVKKILEDALRAAGLMR
ncbi:PHB depolymerase family esterase [Mesorhizobium sp. SB112]|uniref:extracellular catalytic domain type 1 short-chain-length polyhydroxyalkanoate depolymerase n=1 Tax=Mesorhizobium sp. SB112 TaxID=3151853 RepID=UPI00326741F4